MRNTEVYYTWSCCSCLQDTSLSVQLLSRCTTPSCRHERCDRCTVEGHNVFDNAQVEVAAEVATEGYQHDVETVTGNSDPLSQANLATLDKDFQVKKDSQTQENILGSEAFHAFRKKVELDEKQSITVESWNSDIDFSDSEVSVTKPDEYEDVDSDIVDSLQKQIPAAERQAGVDLFFAAVARTALDEDDKDEEYQAHLKRIEERREERRRRRRDPTTEKRTFSQSIGGLDIDIDNEDLTIPGTMEANEIGSSARRLRRKVRERDTLVFDNPAERLVSGYFNMKGEKEAQGPHFDDEVKSSLDIEGGQQDYSLFPHLFEGKEPVLTRSGFRPSTPIFFDDISSDVWTNSHDTQLIFTRSLGMDWNSIQQTHFPARSASACRERHEKLMEPIPYSPQSNYHLGDSEASILFPPRIQESPALNRATTMKNRGNSIESEVPNITQSSRLVSQSSPNNYKTENDEEDHILFPDLSESTIFNVDKNYAPSSLTRKHYGEGVELDGFDDLPTSPQAEKSYTKQPVSRKASNLGSFGRGNPHATTTENIDGSKSSLSDDYDELESKFDDQLTEPTIIEDQNSGVLENKPPYDMEPYEDPSQTFICEICNRQFHRQEHLKRHYRSLHAGDRPFNCGDCGKKFSRKENLAQHARTHGNGAIVMGVLKDDEIQGEPDPVELLGKALYHPPLTKDELESSFDRSDSKVNPYDHPPSKKENSLEFEDYAVALFDFNPENDNELRLLANDYLWVQRSSSKSLQRRKGWLFACHTKFGDNCGLVPATYIKILDSTDKEFGRTLPEIGKGGLRTMLRDDKHLDAVLSEDLDSELGAKGDHTNDTEDHTQYLGADQVVNSDVGFTNLETEQFTQNSATFVSNGQMGSTEGEEDNLSDISEHSGTASLVSVTNSVFSMLSASSMSSAMAAGPQGAAERLVSFFLGDTEIRPLCAEGLSCITPARFERNFRRLLKEFAVALRKEAGTAEHRQAANFVRYRSRNTAHIICNKLNKAPVTSEMIVCQLPLTPTPMVQIDEQEQGEISDNSSDSERDEDSNDNLQHLEVFILNSAAIKLLRGRLRDFVRPPPLQKNKSMATEEGKNVLLPWEFEFAEYPEILEELDTNIIGSVQVRDLIPSSELTKKRLENAIKYGRAFVQNQIKPQLPGYMPPVKSGQTRIEITCKCGQKIIDDYTEQTPGGIARFRELLTELSDMKPKNEGIFAKLCGNTTKYLARNLPGDVIDCGEKRKISVGTIKDILWSQGRKLYTLTCLVVPVLLLYFLLTSIVNLGYSRPLSSSARNLLSIGSAFVYVLIDKLLGSALLKILWPRGLPLIFDCTQVPKERQTDALYQGLDSRQWVYTGLCVATGAGIVLAMLTTTSQGGIVSNSLLVLMFTTCIACVLAYSFTRRLAAAPLVKPGHGQKEVKMIKGLLTKLRVNSISPSQRSTSSSGSTSTLVSAFSRLRNSLGLESKAATDSERGLPLGSLPTPTPTTGTIIPDPALLPPPELLFLLLCYPSGRYATRLLQLDLHSLNTKCDQSLFTLLRINYLSMRKSIFSLKRLQSIKFVRFEMYQSELVDVRKTDDIPPPDHVDYRYLPIPIDVLPPVGESLMMHLFTHPSHASCFPHLLSRLPKKLNKPLQFQPALGMHPSWGLQYLESWDLTKLWIITFVLFGGGSLLWGILWAIYGKSVQDAFAVSAYVVAMVGVFGGTSQALLVM